MCAQASRTSSPCRHSAGPWMLPASSAATARSRPSRRRRRVERAVDAGPRQQQPALDRAGGRGVVGRPFERPDRAEAAVAQGRRHQAAGRRGPHDGDPRSRVAQGGAARALDVEPRRVAERAPQAAAPDVEALVATGPRQHDAVAAGRQGRAAAAAVGEHRVRARAAVDGPGVEPPVGAHPRHVQPARGPGERRREARGVALGGPPGGRPRPVAEHLLRRHVAVGTHRHEVDPQVGTRPRQVRRVAHRRQPRSPPTPARRAPGAGPGRTPRSRSQPGDATPAASSPRVRWAGSRSRA